MQVTSNVLTEGVRPMHIVRRVGVVLVLPTIAYLGTGCERTDMPTAARPMALVADPACSVPSVAYPTIQSAVNDPTCNPINVAAGTYLEPAPGPLTINRTVTLLGAQNGVDARTRSGSESIITDPQGTFVTANNVVIDGFTIENSTVPAFTGFGIAMGAGTTGTQVLNDIIQDNIAGIALSNTGGSQVLIRHNLIQNNNQLPGGASGTGIYTDEFVSGGAVTNVLIEENAFKSNVDAGIDVSNTALPGVSNLDVSTNSFDMNGRAVVFFNTHNSSVHDNQVTNSTLVGSAAIRLFDNNSDLSILNNNVIAGAGNGIRFSFLGLVGSASSNVVIHENNIEFFPAGDGLLVDPVPAASAGTVNAECNWWNSSTGPTNPSNPGGTGEKVVGDADFTPWLVAPAPSGGCSGGVQSGKVTGGGQVPASGGKASFGFNAKNEAGVGSSGHLNYLNHVTGAHLDCTVTAVTALSSTSADFSGPCSSGSSASSFAAHAEDHGTPGKGNDKFTITYGTVVNEGGALISGNIEIHQ
jgi:Right handed beta helix region